MGDQGCEGQGEVDVMYMQRKTKVDGLLSGLQIRMHSSNMSILLSF